MIKRGRKLQSAARHVGVLRLGTERGVGRYLVRRFAYTGIVSRDTASGNRGLRLGAALEQAAFDEQAVDAHVGGHETSISTREPLREAHG